jgi:hypothetical protein
MKPVITFGCLCLLAYARAAAAEWHLTPAVGLTFAADTSIFDVDHGTEKVHPHFGGYVSLLGGGVLGVEGLLVLTPGFFKGDSDIIKSSRSIALMGNVVLTAPRRWTEYNLRPFVSGGVGLLHVSYQEAAGVLPVTQNLTGFNIGGGAIGFLSPRTGLRFDLRYYSNLFPQSPGEGVVLTSDKVHLRYMTGSVGLVLRR